MEGPLQNLRQSLIQLPAPKTVSLSASQGPVIPAHLLVPCLALLHFEASEKAHAWHMWPCLACPRQVPPCRPCHNPGSRSFHLHHASSSGAEVRPQSLCAQGQCRHTAHGRPAQRPQGGPPQAPSSSCQWQRRRPRRSCCRRSPSAPVPEQLCHRATSQPGQLGCFQQRAPVLCDTGAQLPLQHLCSVQRGSLLAPTCKVMLAILLVDGGCSCRLSRRAVRQTATAMQHPTSAWTTSPLSQTHRQMLSPMLTQMLASWHSRGVPT